MTPTSCPLSRQTTAVTRNVPSLGEILRRIAMPFALFSIVLFVLLLLSWFLLLPRFTRVQLHGTSRRPGELQDYVASIQHETRVLEEKRLSLILPLDATSYGALVQEKMALPSLASVQGILLNVAANVLPARRDAVVVQTLHLTGSGGIVEVSGDVRNVGLQSMAVLARFVEAAERFSFVARIDRPVFTRERNTTIGFHSPFHFRLHLQ